MLNLQRELTQMGTMIPWQDIFSQQKGQVQFAGRTQSSRPAPSNGVTPSRRVRNSGFGKRTKRSESKDLEEFWNAGDPVILYPSEDEPRINIVETIDEVVVTAIMPIVLRASDLEVVVQGDLLQIGGMGPGENDDQNGKRSSFRKSVRLPVLVQEEKATASYSRNILKIRLPKESRRNLRRVDVDSHSH